jgi:hypothetical protein
VLIDQPPEEWSQRDRGQARSPRSSDYEYLGDASPHDRRVSYESAGDARDYDSGPTRGTDIKFQIGPGGPGAYQDSADRQARLPAPNNTTNGPSKYKLDRESPPPLDSQVSSVNESELDEHFPRDAARKGHDPDKLAFKYGFPPPGSKPQQYGEPRPDANFDLNPLSKFMNRDMSNDDDRVTVAVSR